MAEPLFLLASGSPRRKALLEALGIPFRTVPNPWDEAAWDGEPAAWQVRRLAREKLNHFLELNPENQIPVLTADTLLSFRGRAVNKPDDAEEAWAFYRQLAGRTHRVLTSVVLHLPDRNRTIQRTESTAVTFVPWDESLYRSYWNRGEWHDAAGGYRIQETGAILVKKLRGSWSNVVGLPIAEVYAMIRQNLRVPEV
jgi:septum formation protein